VRTQNDRISLEPRAGRTRAVSACITQRPIHRAKLKVSLVVNSPTSRSKKIMRFMRDISHLHTSDPMTLLLRKPHHGCGICPSMCPPCPCAPNTTSRSKSGTQWTPRNHRTHWRGVIEVSAYFQQLPSHRAALERAGIGMERGAVGAQ